MLPARLQFTGKVRNLPEIFRLLEKKASTDLRKLKKIIKKGEPASTVNRHPLLLEASVRAF